MIRNRTPAQDRGVAHHSLCQVSNATALVQGIYQGAVCVGDLRERGDLGLGTFVHLDGEMAIVDGHLPTDCHYLRRPIPHEPARVS
jgi:hypothetical protein